jgi:hypothetical protein
MPLKMNVGLNRKITDNNYGSRGASVNVELELDSGLVNEPAKLQEKIRQLFGLVRTSLVEELNGNGQQASTGNGQQANGNAGGQKTNAPRPATQSQIKAIHAIARNQGLNVAQLLRERFHVAKPEDLTIGEASQLIDQLKNAKAGGAS